MKAIKITAAALALSLIAAAGFAQSAEDALEVFEETNTISRNISDSELEALIRGIVKSEVDNAAEIDAKVQEELAKYKASSEEYIKNLEKTLQSKSADEMAAIKDEYSQKIEDLKSSYEDILAKQKASAEADKEQALQDQAAQFQARKEAEEKARQDAEAWKWRQTHPFDWADWWWTSASDPAATFSVEWKQVNHQGKDYGAVNMKMNTGNWQKKDGVAMEIASDFWGQMQYFTKGNTLRFFVLGDGNAHMFRVTQRDGEKRESTWVYKFSTKKGKVTEVKIPFNKMTFWYGDSTFKLDPSKFSFVSFCLGAFCKPDFKFNVPKNKDYEITIFDASIF